MKSMFSLSASVFVFSLLFSLFAMLARGQTILPLGVPVVSTTPVAQGNFVYYQFNASAMIPQLQGNEQLGIALTALSGDPDLYISTTGNPTTNSYNWVGTWYGGDLIRIGYTQGYQSTATFYVGVYGNTQASYSILAYKITS